jgi:hypothetical protein
MKGNHTRFLLICPVVLPKQQIEFVIRSLNSFNCITRDLTWKVLSTLQRDLAYNEQGTKELSDGDIHLSEINIA